MRVCVLWACGLACALDDIGADSHPVVSKSTLDVGLVGGGGGYTAQLPLAVFALNAVAHLEWRVMFMHPPPPSLNLPSSLRSVFPTILRVRCIFFVLSMAGVLHYVGRGRGVDFSCSLYLSG